MTHPDDKKLDERREISADRTSSLDEELEGVERALINSRKFLESLAGENDDLRGRAEGIAASYERGRDRLRAKKPREPFC